MVEMDVRMPSCMHVSIYDVVTLQEKTLLLDYCDLLVGNNGIHALLHKGPSHW
jgi:hypothetical protein